MKTLILIRAGAAALAAQSYQNLDFESVTRGRLRGWFLGTPGYEMAPDNATAASGTYSMRLRSTGADALAPTSILLPLELTRGRHVKISGFIRTQESPAPGYAAIWFRVDGAAGTLALRNMSEVALRGTNDWKRYEYEVDVAPEAIRVILGTFLAGRGTAWFDNLQVEIDGRLMSQGPAPFIGEPTTAQLDWIRQNSIPLRTEQAETGFDDLQALKPLIGNARIVGLGEATHGTAEFFRMKHRLMEFLATEAGFTIFSIEANLPESYRMNDYVMTGRGDPKKLLQGMYFWTWNTQEVLDMVEWMRKFNQSGRGRVQFTGFDMQTATVAAGIVREFVARADPAYLATLDDAYSRVIRAASLPNNSASNFAAILAAAVGANAARRHLEDNYRLYSQALPMAEVEWAIQNARVTEQASFLAIGGDRKSVV